MNDIFIIPLNGLAVGKNEFSWHAGKEFFDSFENTEILDAQLDVRAVAEKSGRYIGVDCEVGGRVVVECDRCLDELELPVDVMIRLSVKFGEDTGSDEASEGDDREVVFVPVTDTDFDLGQVIYDYVCLSLPFQRIHRDGQCNPAAMKYLDSAEDSPVDNSPFSALKNMF